jgi:hypothetical protein
MVNEKTVSDYFGMTETDFLEAVRRGKIKARNSRANATLASQRFENYKAPPPPKVDDARLEAVVKRSLHRTRS